MNMPDNFPNISATCVLGRLVIESTGGDKAAWGYVERNAPECRGHQTGGAPGSDR